jgi:hypothetical protein
MEQKNQLLDDVEYLLKEGKMEQALDLLVKFTDTLDPKIHQNLIDLKQRLYQITIDQTRGILAYDVYLTECSKISHALSYIVKQIHLPTPNKQAAGKKQGKVLYAIPGSMPLNIETKCMVRIAEEEALLWENLKEHEHAEVEDIRVAQIMEVALIDLSGGRDFEIRTLNTADQYIESDDYSEWIFYVKPVSAGNKKLFLKISTIQKIDGVEKRKEIVLEKIVEVTSSEQIAMTELHWSDSQIVLSTQKEMDHFLGLFETPNAQGAKFVKVFAILFLIALSSGIYALIHQVDWGKTFPNPAPAIQPVQIPKTAPALVDSLSGVSATSNINHIEPTVTSQRPIKRPKLPEQPLKSTEPAPVKQDSLTTNTAPLAKQEPVTISHKKRPDVGLYLTDQVRLKDTVKLGKPILITLRASGINTTNLYVFNADGLRLKPVAVDGKLLYFEFPSSAEPFKLKVMDNDSKVQKERIFKGNTNCSWYVQRMLGSKVDRQ